MRLDRCFVCESRGGDDSVNPFDLNKVHGVIVHDPDVAILLKAYDRQVAGQGSENDIRY